MTKKHWKKQNYNWRKIVTILIDIITISNREGAALHFVLTAVHEQLENKIRLQIIFS